MLTIIVLSFIPLFKKDNVNPGYKIHNGIVGDIHDGLIKPFDGFWVQAGLEGHHLIFQNIVCKRSHGT